MSILNKTCILCLTEKLWIISFINNNNYLNKKSELINKCKRINKCLFKNVRRCIVFSKICFDKILSYIGINELAFIACRLIGLCMGYRALNKINFRLYYSFLCFIVGINSCTICLMTAEA